MTDKAPAKPEKRKVQRRKQPMVSATSATEPDVAIPWTGFWLTLAAALLYCAWIGAHWLPLDMSDKELAATASRVWDFRREIVEHHGVPWWTPYFMSGSSYAMARGFGLVPWLLFSTVTDLITAGKLVALSAILASAIAMYFCARHFLKNDWAALLSAAVYMLHPEQLIRAAGTEHVTICLFFPFIPLLWLTFSRAIESNTFRDVVVCALTAVLAWWTDNKQALVNFAFLSAWAVYWLVLRRRHWKSMVRTYARLAVVGLGLGAPLVVPSLLESRFVTLFPHDSLTAWQRMYSFKSLLELVDRDGWLSAPVSQAVTARLQANGGRVRRPEEHDELRRIFALALFSPEKYMGLGALALIGATALFNVRRFNQRVYRFFLTAFFASVACASGPSTVWNANWTTSQALWSQEHYAAAVIPLALLSLFGATLLKVKQSRQLALGCVTLVGFLFLPAFTIIGVLPYFDAIRAPYVFYDGPGTFWVAMLTGFFVTDVVDRDSWRRHVPVVVAASVLLLMLDYWPYQMPTADNNVPAHTLANLRATYTALANDQDWVKTYYVSSRYFHLIGTTYSGKPQTYEAFNNWLAPAGIGALDRVGGGSLEYLNLLGARYVVFDKSDRASQEPRLQQLLDLYRRAFAVDHEDDDFVVFRNDQAHRYVTAYAKSCAFVGDLSDSARLSLTLARRDWPLVDADKAADASQYEKIYRSGMTVDEPTGSGEIVSLQDLRLKRLDNEHVDIHLAAPKNCLAVIAESYYPYWRADVDGTAVDVRRVSTGLMGIQLDAGTHDIRLHYEVPATYGFAGALSVITFVVCIGILAANRNYGDGKEE